MKSVLLSSRQGVRARLKNALPQLVLAADEAGLPVAASATLLWLDVAGQSGDALLERVQNLVRLGYRVVTLAAEMSETQAFALMAAGAVGYAHLLAPATQLQQIAVVVENGGVWAGQDLTRRIMRLALSRAQAPQGRTGRLDSLTEREREVAALVAAGASNREIAASMSVSERTVKAHLTSIFAKLRVRDRVQLALAVVNASAS